MEMEERDDYRNTIEQLDSMAASPQWRNEPLYRISEITEQALKK